MEIPRLGKYKHYKGSLYELIHIARHSEEPDVLMAVYRALYGEGEVWVRPLSMWDEEVIVNGCVTRRFTYAGD